MFGDAVGEDGPAVGGGDGEVEDGLEVGLVEGGEDALDVIHEDLRVRVRLAVGGVGEAVHAFAGVRVGHGGLDAQFVGAGGEAGEGEPVVVECGGVQGVSVEGDGSQVGGPDLDEGVSARAGGEADDGGGVEGVGSAGEIEVDRVPLDVDELGSGLRFVARQYGHGDMLPDGRGTGQRPPAAPGGGAVGPVSGGGCPRDAGLVGDLFVVADHFADDEVEELLGEGGVEFGALGELAQAGDLVGFAGGVGRGQGVFGLEVADLLGAFEAFGEHVDDGGVDVVDAVAQAGEFGADGGVHGVAGVAVGHGRKPYVARGRSAVVPGERSIGGSSGSGTVFDQPPGTVRPCCSRKRTGAVPTRRVNRREK